MPSRPANASPKRVARLAAQADALALARGRLGLSQPAAAAAFGVSVWTYRSWEHGLRQPGPDARRAIARAFGVDPRILAVPDGGRCPHCGRSY